MLESQADHENHINNRTSAVDEPPERVLAFISGIAILLCLVLGALGNLWIMIVVLVRREMRSNLINLFIASLCLNDLLNLLLNQSMVAVSYLAGSWKLGPLLCELMPELNMLLVCVSLWHHALISLHRYIVVVHNSTYVQLHKGLYAGIILAGTRVFGALLSLSLPLFNSGSWRGSTVYQAKMLRCIYERTQRFRILGVVIISQLIPCAIVIVCFALIFVFVRRANTGSLVSDQLLMRRELRITKMFGVVFLMFLVGFLPYGCLRMIDSGNTLGPQAYVLVTLLYAAASSVNPLIFGAMNREIRLACLRLISRRSSRASAAAATGASTAAGTASATAATGNKVQQKRQKKKPVAAAASVVEVGASKNRCRPSTELSSSLGSGATAGPESRQLLSVSDPDQSCQQESDTTLMD